MNNLDPQPIGPIVVRTFELLGLLDQAATHCIWLHFRRRLCSRVFRTFRDLIAEYGVPEDQFREAFKLFSLRVCAIHPVSDAKLDSNSRIEVLCCVAADLLSLATWIAEYQNRNLFSIDFQKTSIIDQFDSEPSSLLAGARSNGPISGSIPRNYGSLHFLQAADARGFDVKRAFANSIAAMLFAPESPAHFPISLYLAGLVGANLESTSKSIVSTLLETIDDTICPPIQMLDPIRIIAEARKRFRLLLEQDELEHGSDRNPTAPTTVFSDKQITSVSEDPAESSILPRGENRPLVGALIFEPDLSIEPGSELEEASRVQRLTLQIKENLRPDDQVGRLDFHRVFAICRISSSTDLRLITNRVIENLKAENENNPALSVRVGGIVIDATEAPDTDLLNQMALIRLDAARRKASGIDIFSYDTESLEILRFDLHHLQKSPQAGLNAAPEPKFSRIRRPSSE